MTKDKALHWWFSKFMTAYPVTSVPDDVVFPYLTYEPVFDSWSGGEVSLTVNLWFHTESEAIPNAMADGMSRLIGLGGVTIPCDGGYIWLKRGTPWCTSLNDETSPSVKRRYLNVTADYLTEN